MTTNTNTAKDNTMNKPIKNQFGTYEYKGIKVSRSGDKSWPWVINMGGTTNRIEFQTIAAATAFIDTKN